MIAIAGTPAASASRDPREQPLMASMNAVEVADRNNAPLGLFRGYRPIRQSRSPASILAARSPGFARPIGMPYMRCQADDPSIIAVAAKVVNPRINCSGRTYGRVAHQVDQTELA